MHHPCKTQSLEVHTGGFTYCKCCVWGSGVISKLSFMLESTLKKSNSLHVSSSSRVENITAQLVRLIRECGRTSTH